MEDNVDELVRLCHKAWLEGEDAEWFDYAKVDKDE